MRRFQITITAPDLSQSKHLLIDRLPLRLGRAPENDLALPYGSISGHHLTIDRHGDRGLIVTDLGSTNGTHLADQQLIPHQPQPILIPCELRLGDVLLAIAPFDRQPDDAFTCVHSETHLRELVDGAARQSQTNQESLPFFEILSGPGSGRRLVLDFRGKTARMGTTYDAEIHLELPGLPPKLAEIDWRDDRFWITSHTSELLFHGRSLNSPRAMHSGDRFILGAMELLFFDPLEDALQVVTTGAHQTLEPEAPPPEPILEDTPAPPELVDDIDDEEDINIPDPRPAPEKTRLNLRPLELAILAISVVLLLGALGFLWLFFNAGT